MKIIIAGSRGITDFDIQKAVDASGFEITEVVSGGAIGVDRLGEKWAKEHNIPISRFIPDWTKGRGAGFKRNCEMGEYADGLIAIWDSNSNGTRQMINFMQDSMKPSYVYRKDIGDII